MPRGLKISSRTGPILYDSAWIAGVDYDEEAFDEYDDDTYNDDDEYEEENSADTDSDNEYESMDPNDIYEFAHQEQHEHEDDESNPSTVEQNDSDSEQEQEQEQEQHHEEEQDLNEDNIKRTRSGRTTKPPDRLNMIQYTLPTQTVQPLEYTNEKARVIVTVMCHMNDKLSNPKNHKAQQFLQTYSLLSGLKKFGQKGRVAAIGELKQLHDRVVFRPIRVSDLTPLERKRAMESLIFLSEKRDGTVKGRMCANGSSQRSYIRRDEAASPTAMTESILITATIDAKQKRDVMTSDIPNAFVQTDVDKHKIGERIVMKIKGPMVDMLIEMAPEIYSDYVIEENGRKVLYVMILKALYGMLQSSLLYYNKFRKDIESIGFEVNPFDPCVANRIVNGKQHTVVWHVDDLKSSHVDPKVNDEFLKWLEEKYASDNVGKVKSVRGKRHDYLAMWLDFSEEGVLQIDMRPYVHSMIEDFSGTIGKSKQPWNEKLFRIDKKSNKLDEERAKEFHTFVMKGMFLFNEPDPSNTNAPRTLDCIYLRYTDNDQGGHELLHLATNRIITRRQVTPIPLTPAAIQAVHTLAENQGMPRGLKISSRTGPILYDSAWIAGVDYDEEAFDEYDDDTYNDDDKYEEENSADTDSEEENSADTDSDNEHESMDPNDIYEFAHQEQHEHEDDESNPSTVEQNDSDSEQEQEQEQEQHHEEEQDLNEHNIKRTRSGRTLNRQTD
ncbi:reverse transcriptase RNA-dependent DNA polymerase [Nitzschia inconspicua]|uniref:Reverse transcriptase RNA-dependent DNA polymerase n=1 Tax=Nitzschia inconspicua TaxID=303405 RepID=A0A9K3PKH8_9STRA|nr:reverse transcriptase RNA-dependent DNA polymerase [Nitzschia inconspicua]